MKKIALTILGLLGAMFLVGSSIAAVDGSKVYEQNCSRCHSARPPVERNDRQWRLVVAHMRVRGNLTAEEAQEVLEYLQASN